MGVKRSQRGLGHQPHLAPRLKKEYGYTSTPPLGFHGLFYDELYVYVYLHFAGNTARMHWKEY